MKTKLKSNYLLVSALLLLLNASHGLADAVPTQVDSTPSASSTEQLADRCTDFTTNGWAFKAPRNFLKWLDAFTDPAIFLEFADRSMEPQAYVRTLSSMLEPAAVRNHLEWSNPEIYNQWVQAAAEPQFYSAVTTIVTDPGRLTRWIMLPLDERVWKLAEKSLNPETWLKWLNAPADPNTEALIAKAANPETARLWMEALTNPNNTPWFNLPPAASDDPSAVPSHWIKPVGEKIRL